MPLKNWIACLIIFCSFSLKSQDSLLQIDESRIDEVALEVLQFRKEDSLKRKNEILSLLKSEDPLTQAKGYYELGAFHWLYDQLDSGIYYKKEAARRYGELEEYDLQVKTLNFIGWIYMTQFQYTQSYESLLAAKDICKEQMVDSVEIAYLDKGIGTLFNYQGDFKKSREYYEKAFAYFVKHGCSEGLASSYNCLAIQSYDDENYEQEFELTQKAFECAETLERDRVYIRMSLNLGNLYSRRGEYEKGVEYYNKALEAVLSTRSKSLKFISLTYLHFAWMQKKNGNYRSALRLYEKAEKWIKKSERKRELYLSRVYRHSSDVFAELHDHEKALESHKKYMEVLNVINNKEATLKMSNLEKEYAVAIEKERLDKATIKVRLLTVSSVLLLILILAIIFYRKKIGLAHEDLVQRNIEIVELEVESHVNQATISNQNENKIKKSEKYASSSLETKQKEALLKELIEVMEREQLYMDTELSIGSVAEQLNSNRRYLSQAVNELLNKNFSSFVNQYRIQEARKRMGSKEFQNYTVEAIARDTGFKSISSFNAAFLKFTGVTPSVFFKKVKETKTSVLEEESLV